MLVKDQRERSSSKEIFQKLKVTFTLIYSKNKITCALQKMAQERTK